MSEIYEEREDRYEPYEEWVDWNYEDPMDAARDCCGVCGAKFHPVVGCFCDYDDPDEYELRLIEAIVNQEKELNAGN